MTKRGVHDMGGNPAGPVDHSEHQPSLTERRIDAMMQLLRAKPRAFWRTDENRRTIESLAPETYNSSGYYEKWAYAMRSLLIEKGILDASEIDARLAEVKQRHGALRAAGKTPRRDAAGKDTGPAARTKSAAADAAPARPKSSKPAAAKTATTKSPENSGKTVPRRSRTKSRTP